MAKLYFYYGAMGAAKTAQAITTRFNYEERGMKALLLKPSLDTRDGTGIIRSRIGLEAPCEPAEKYLRASARSLRQSLKGLDCVIVDEAQFLSENDVMTLAEIVDGMDIPVLCYGLRTDFQGHLFDGSAALMAHADKIIELKTMCWCGRKTTHNARFNERGIVRHGEQVALGGIAKRKKDGVQCTSSFFVVQKPV